MLGYIQGEFPILKAHSPEFAGMYYADLTDEVQRDFLSYNFFVNLLQNVSDEDVLSIFARINTYTVRLNAQELRNAEFFGVFKQIVYKLAQQHYAFWRNNNILSDHQIARMLDAELVSELTVSTLDSIRETKAQDLKQFYSRYDDDFPQSNKVVKEFEQIINIIGNIFGDTLKSSQFKRIPLFYSLFCAIYDAKFGLPGSDRPCLSFTASENKCIAEKLHKLDNIITSKEPPQENVPFIDAARSSTAGTGRRQLRHKFIWDKILT